MNTDRIDLYEKIFKKCLIEKPNSFRNVIEDVISKDEMQMLLSYLGLNNDKNKS